MSSENGYTSVALGPRLAEGYVDRAHRLRREFIRQSRSIIASWQGAGVQTGYVEIAGEDHFTVLTPLSSSDSEHTAKLAELALGPR